MGSIGGQSSGDFTLSSGALRILYSVVKDSIPALTADAFTQSNPPVVTAAAAVSTTLPATVKKGVLGGSVAFTRNDEGENLVGGPTKVGGVYYSLTLAGGTAQVVSGMKPVGLFINDALGNAYENTPGVASGKGPFLRGGSVGLKIYETERQTTTGGGVVGNDLTYNVGDRLYASVNGLVTNVWEDTYEAQAINAGGGTATEADCTRLGLVLAPPNATSTEMFLMLSFI
jgi:hypothetical protein